LNPDGIFVFCSFLQNYFSDGKSLDYPWALTDEKMIISAPWVVGQGTGKETKEISEFTHDAL
jgi:hypothetical protein